MQAAGGGLCGPSGAGGCDSGVLRCMSSSHTPDTGAKHLSHCPCVDRSGRTLAVAAPILSYPPSDTGNTTTVYLADGLQPSCAWCHLWEYQAVEANGCLSAEVTTGGTTRILTMGSRKPHSWLLTPMIEGIGLNVFLVNRSTGSSGKTKPSTTRVKALVF